MSRRRWRATAESSQCGPRPHGIMSPGVRGLEAGIIFLNIITITIIVTMIIIFCDYYGMPRGP